MAQEERKVDEKLLASIVNDLEPTILDSQRNVNIANFIIHEACQKHYYIYQSKWIPISFMEFMFEEYKRYEFMSTIYLKPFFEIYTPEDIPALVENYYNSNYSIIKKKANRNDELCYFIETRFYIDAKLSDPNLLGGFDPDLYKNLDNISTHLDKNDEILSTREIYENFMMRKVVLSKKTNLANPEAETVITQAETTETEAKLADGTTNRKLVGSQVDMPNQKGRVVKLFFPKLSLPSPYPILTDKSRIDSSRRAKRLASPDKQVTLINKYRFNGVKYSVFFIEKRKTAAKPAKKKFDFDF